MISLKGPGLKIFTAILAVIALAFDFIDHENNKTTDPSISSVMPRRWTGILSSSTITIPLPSTVRLSKQD